MDKLLSYMYEINHLLLQINIWIMCSKFVYYKHITNKNMNKGMIIHNSKI